MPDVNAVEVVLRANTAQLVSGMKEAASSTGSATSAMRDEVASLAGASRNAHAPMTGLVGAMKEWRIHVRDENRYTQFLANQVAGLGIASKGAAAEVTGFVSAFAFGGGIGVAVEGVKAVGHFFGELAEAERNAKEELNKYAEDGKKAFEKLREQVEVLVLTMHGATKTEILQHTLMKPMLEERKKLRAEIGLAEKNLKEAAQDEATSEQEALAKTNIADDLDLKTKKERLRILDELIKKSGGQLGTLGKEESNEAAKDAALDMAKFRSAEVQDAKKRYDQVTADLAKSLTEQDRIEKEHLLRQSKAEYDAAIALSKMSDEQLAYRRQRVLEQEKREDAQLEARKRQVASFVNGIEGAMSRSIHSIIDGSKSVSEAMLDMVKGFAAAVIDGFLKMAAEAIIAAITGKLVAKVAAISTTQGHIAEAVSGAAASQAFIPVVGPGLAAAAAAKMLTMLQGITAPLLSSAGGLDRVPADGTLAVLHKQETVLSKPFADGLHDLIAGGSRGGGTTINIHASALDRRWWDQHKTEIVRTIRDATREGRFD